MFVRSEFTRVEGKLLGELESWCTCRKGRVTEPFLGLHCAIQEWTESAPGTKRRQEAVHTSAQVFFVSILKKILKKESFLFFLDGQNGIDQKELELKRLSEEV